MRSFPFYDVAMILAWLAALSVCSVGVLTESMGISICGTLSINVASVLTIVSWTQHREQRRDEMLDEVFDIGRETGMAEEAAKYRAAQAVGGAAA